MVTFSRCGIKLARGGFFRRFGKNNFRVVPDIKMAPQAKIFSFLDSVNAISKGKMTSEWTRMSKFSPAAPHAQGGIPSLASTSAFAGGDFILADSQGEFPP